MDFIIIGIYLKYVYFRSNFNLILQRWSTGTVHILQKQENKIENSYNKSKNNAVLSPA